MPESYEHEVRVAGGSGHDQNPVFLDVQRHNIDFLSWWCVALFKLISVIFGFWYFF